MKEIIILALLVMVCIAATKGQRERSLAWVVAAILVTVAIGIIATKNGGTP